MLIGMTTPKYFPNFIKVTILKVKIYLLVSLERFKSFCHIKLCYIFNM